MFFFDKYKDLCYFCRF